MDSRKLIAGLFLGSMLLVGCEETGQDTQRGPGASRTTPSAPQGGQNVQVRAQTLIDQANEHIRNRDYQAAENTLRELENMRTQLPQEMQQQITAVRSSLNAAKQGQGATPQRPPSGTTPPPSEPPDTDE